MYFNLQSFFSHIAYLFGFFMFSWLPHFDPKMFCFPCIRFMVCLRAITLFLWVQFVLLVFGMFCFICIVLSYLDIFVVFLLSPVHSAFFPRIVLSLLFFLSVLTCSCIFPWLVVVDFLFENPNMNNV